MSEIGRKGLQGFTDRNVQGDRDRATARLRTRAHEMGIEGFVGRELARRLGAGEEVACMEPAVPSEPEDGLLVPSFGRPPRAHPRLTA